MTIGILGGMGPRATLEFERRLLHGLSGTDQELPTIVSYYASQTPDRTAYLLSGGADPVAELRKGLRVLENAKVDFVVMPCNTAHAPAIFERLRESTALPFVNLIEEVIDTARSRAARDVLLLATEGTIATGIYEDAALARDVAIVRPDQSLQELVNELIAALKSDQTETSSRLSSRIVRRLRDYKVDAIILGCTELPLVGRELSAAGVPIIDCLDTLVARTAQIVLSGAQKRKIEV